MDDGRTSSVLGEHGDNLSPFMGFVVGQRPQRQNTPYTCKVRIVPWMWVWMRKVE